ncbi:hypothetical protein ABH927_006580 [Planotetraspora sp. GP83]
MAGVGDCPLEGRRGAGPGGGDREDCARADESASGAEGRSGTGSQSAEAAQPKSQVPVWREGLAWSALSVDYQRILQLGAGRARLGQGPVTCQEMAAAFGMVIDQ